MTGRKPRPRTRSTSIGSGTTTNAPLTARRLSVGGTPVGTTTFPPRQVTPAPSTPSAAPKPPDPVLKPMPVKQKRTAAEIQQETFDKKRKTIVDFMENDRIQVVPQMTPSERDTYRELLRTASLADYARDSKTLDDAVRALGDIRNRQNPIPDSLDLDIGRGEPSDEFKEGVRKTRNELKKEFSADPGKIQDGMDRVERLIEDEKWATAEYILSRLGTSARAGVKVVEESIRKDFNTPERDEELKQPDLPTLCAEKAALGQFDLLRAALVDLKKTRIGAEERAAITHRLIEAALGHPEVMKQVDAHTDVFGELLGAAADLAKNPPATPTFGSPTTYVPTVVARLGPSLPAVAVQALSTSFVNATRFDEATMRTLIEAVPLATWRDTKLGLAARVLNNLWRGKRFQLITELIDKDADTNQSTLDPQGDTGRSIEGVWSGFVQPLEHLMGTYVRLASLPDDNWEVKAKRLDRVRGARQVLAALEAHKKATILTEYSKVQGSGLLKAFAGRAGTIWGFEDVRMPYVQAAHDARDGQQPLRMWEMWDAIEPVMNEAKYNQLFSDPIRTMDELVARATAMHLEKAAKRPDEYVGRTSDEYVERLADQCRSYLTYLVTNSPEAKHATAELSGRTVTKWMGALACKAGLWWAKENDAPVYYCIDGLNLQDVYDFKSMKTKNINAFVAARYDPQPGDPAPRPYLEVITLAEVREILKNWDDDLEHTVTFYEKGEPVPKATVKEWITKMKAADSKTAGTRKAPPARVFEERLDRIDPWLANYVDDKVAMQIVARAENVRTAGGWDPALLAVTLEDCKVLYDNGVLPVDLPRAFRVLLAARTREEKVAAAEELKTNHLADLTDYMRKPLADAIDNVLTR